MCKSHRMNVFIGVIYAYKGLLLVSDGDDAGDNDEDGESRNIDCGGELLTATYNIS